MIAIEITGSHAAKNGLIAFVSPKFSENALIT